MNFIYSILIRRDYILIRGVDTGFCPNYFRRLHKYVISVWNTLAALHENSASRSGSPSLEPLLLSTDFKNIKTPNPTRVLNSFTLFILMDLNPRKILRLAQPLAIPPKKSDNPYPSTSNVQKPRKRELFRDGIASLFGSTSGRSTHAPTPAQSPSLVNFDISTSIHTSGIPPYHLFIKNRIRRILTSLWQSQIIPAEDHPH